MMLSKTICALCVAAVAFSGSAVDASTEVAETFGWLLPKSYATYGGYGDAGAGANGYGGAAAGTSGYGGLSLLKALASLKAGAGLNA
ncbi:hypothetical protein PC128_g25039, partial [Phytophthora cactorum]